MKKRGEKENQPQPKGHKPIKKKKERKEALQATKAQNRDMDLNKGPHIFLGFSNPLYFVSPLHPNTL